MGGQTASPLMWGQTGKLFTIVDNTRFGDVISHSSNSSTTGTDTQPYRWSGLLALLVLLTGAALWIAPVHQSSAAIQDLEDTALPKGEVKQSKTTKLINVLLDKSHYRDLALDDSFSEDVLNRYLDQLDPSRYYFLREDIDQFRQLKFEFDDFIKTGTLRPVYAIFSIYRTRVEQRVEYALDRLAKPFDFTLDEEMVLDRTEIQWPQTESDMDDAWRKRIKNDILNLRLTEKSEEEILDSLERRYTHLARRTRQLNNEDVFQTFINAYVGNLEPHTSYFSPRATENFKIHLRLSLEGIGAVLQTDNEYTLVRRVIPGGPADMAGDLKAEDRIIGVGQGDDDIVEVIGWRLDDVVELIRGPKASIVRLEILPGEQGLEAESEVITIQRDEIKLEEQAAKKRIIELETDLAESRIGIIDLPSFYVDFDGMHRNDPDFRSTTRDVRKLIKEFEEEGIDGLVIDLRGNGGGSLTEAIALTGLFIETGPVVQVRNSGGHIQIDRDPDPEIAYEGPLAVLVDRYSASASEIFAGAIQDYHRGIVIGEPTFGKGTVQNLVNLNNYAKDLGPMGQLKVTIAQFFRVNGDSTQHRGVVPDLIWDNIDDYDEFGERSYENALPFNSIEEAEYTPFTKSIALDKITTLISRHHERTMVNAEYQFARNLGDLNRQRRERESITLNEVKREQDRESLDSQRLELENTLRRSKGEQAFASIDELEDHYEERDKARERDANSQEPDFFLKETGRILSDWIMIDSQFENNLLVKRQAQSEGLLSN
ncbi:MAG: carboxy terminal-processing peptidase [Pseudomonadota bacterium]